MTENGKHVADSCVTLSRLMGPQDANGHGNVHGGVVMKMADEAAALAAMRHSGQNVVTVAIDSMTFMQPIRLGMFVQWYAELTYVGRTSMEVRVEVTAEHPFDGQADITNTAFLVFVAIDHDGKPTPVPPLILDTEEQHIRAEHAKERQEFRKQQRAKEV